MATFLLVAGAWHGRWCWERVIPLLEAQGHKVVAPDLPGMGADRQPLTNVGFEDWVRFIASQAMAQTEPVILVGHSRAGILISQVAELIPEAIRTNVYLAAFMLAPGTVTGEFISQAADFHVLEAIETATDGKTTTVLPDRVGTLFYNETDPVWAARAQDLLTPEPSFMLAVELKLSCDRYAKVPRAYIECIKDMAVPVRLQRLMQEEQPCWHVSRLNTDHSPFYSAPEDLAAIFSEIAQLSKNMTTGG